MLTITPTAADILTKTRSDKGAPEGYGVRFYTTTVEEDSGRARLAFAFVDAPKEDDTVLDDTGIEAYVAPEVDRLIGDVTVDARQQGEEMGLVVRRAAQS
jgi:Fe-S cluster assembly iron-binding protein IscA